MGETIPCTDLEDARNTFHGQGGWLLSINNGASYLCTDDEKLVLKLRGEEFINQCEALKEWDETLIVDRLSIDEMRKAIIDKDVDKACDYVHNMDFDGLRAMLKDYADLSKDDIVRLYRKRIGLDKSE